MQSLTYVIIIMMLVFVLFNSNIRIFSIPLKTVLSVLKMSLSLLHPLLPPSFRYTLLRVEHWWSCQGYCQCRSNLRYSVMQLVPYVTLQLRSNMLYVYYILLLLLLLLLLLNINERERRATKRGENIHKGEESSIIIIIIN